MKSSVSNPKVEFEKMVDVFWKNNPFNMHDKFVHELEVRFGTKGAKITKIDYDKVISKIKSFGFSVENPAGSYMLRIQDDSDVRTEIEGLLEIQQYCKTNTVKQLQNIKFNRKTKAVDPVDFEDFNFRVSYQREEELKRSHHEVVAILENWTDTKKYHRFMNRITFIHPEIPVKIDFSVVKSAGENKRKSYVPSTISEVDIFSSPEHFEIELEVDNTQIGPFKDINSSVDLIAEIRKVIKFVLMGLQGTNYPVSVGEKAGVITEYMQLVHGEQYSPGQQNITAKNFIGPSTYTLQMENIVEPTADIVAPNIRENYTVTDKADGSRNMLYISKAGKLYLITSSMQIIFTGAMVENRSLIQSLFDGELIYHNRIGDFINLFAVFDVYYVNGKDVRSHGFVNDGKGKPSDVFRLDLLKANIKLVIEGIKSVVPHKPSPIKIASKKFYVNTATTSIFDNCLKILQNDSQGLFEYNTDGLIFTPSNMGVGLDKIGGQSPNRRIAWRQSFKWKAPEFNTIDFLVSTEKLESKVDIVTPVFQQGTTAGSAIQLFEYKTLALRVGVDTAKHMYLNPCQDIMEDKMPLPTRGADNENKYLPLRFYPSDPPDERAGIVNIMLKKDEVGNNQMYTEGGEMFEDETIVEFKYVHERENGWKWVPIKVRYDKTSEYRNGEKNFGNDYDTANNNWKTIHKPLTLEMITTGQNIPAEIIDDSVYYSNISSKSTKALRDFHNLFVKKALIVGASKKGDTLIDFSVGKAGDFPKWIEANLDFVFGIDIHNDNIENKINGACVRYFTYYKMHKKIPKVLFINGDSSLNIRSGEAMLNDKAIAVSKAVFGQGTNDPKKLGQGVANQYAKGQNGFDVASCQFSMHYFFKNESTFKNFIANVCECTKVGGFFVATCYDGKLVYDALSKTKPGDSIMISDSAGQKMWEIQKLYADEKFEDDITSLGFEINVYQESIGKMFSEYLVNFTYLNRIMENYGFRLLTKEESVSMNLPQGSASFSELFNQMSVEMMKSRGRGKIFGTAQEMTAHEKYISFLNRYVVYKKILKVNPHEVSIELFQDVKMEKKHEPVLPKAEPTTPLKEIDIPKVIKVAETIILLPAEAVKEDEKEIVLEEEKIEEEEEVVVPKKTTKRKTTKAVVEETAAEEEIPKKTTKRKTTKAAVETAAEEEVPKKTTKRKTTKAEPVVEEPVMEKTEKTPKKTTRKTKVVTEGDSEKKTSKRKTKTTEI